MAVSPIPRKAGPFFGNGSVTDFPFGFKVTSVNDVRIVVYNESTKQEQVLASGYSVKLNANQEGSPGGVVKLNSPLTEGMVMAVVSNVTSSQDLVLTNRGGFYPDSINDALDKMTMLIQQVQEEASRCLRVRVTSQETPEEAAARLENTQEIASRFAEIAIEAANAAELTANRCLAYSNQATESAERAERAAADIESEGGSIKQLLNGFMKTSMNLGDVEDVVQARVNLGLGSAATMDSTEFASVKQIENLLSEEEGDGRYLQAAEANSLFASKTYVDENFVTETALTDYLLKTDATQHYLSKTEAGSTYVKKSDANAFALKTDLNGFITAEALEGYATVDQVEGFLTEAEADGRYIQSSEAESLFVSKSYIDSNFVTNEAVKDFVTADQVDGFLTETEADGKYLAKSASSTFALKTDISGLLSTTTAASTYLSKSDASSTYATKASLNGYATTASLAGYLTEAEASDLYLEKTAAGQYALKSDITGFLSATTAASTYLSKTDASSTYLSKTDASSTYATKSSLSSYATTASLSNYATTESLGDYAKTSALANYLPKTGSRGAVAGYQTISVSSATSLTVTKATADDTCISTSSAVTVTVPDGDSGTAWSKSVAVSSGGLSVSLGDAWSWANGEEPELTAKGIVVLYWAGVFGVADFVGA